MRPAKALLVSPASTARARTYRHESEFQNLGRAVRTVDAAADRGHGTGAAVGL